MLAFFFIVTCAALYGWLIGVLLSKLTYRFL